MDIRVAAGDVVPQKEDIFHVEVITREILGEESLQMELLDYDRLTLYGKYAVCADDSVQLKLCVCSQDPSEGRPNIAPLSPKGWVHFGEHPAVRKFDSTNCLQFVTWSYGKKSSNAYELANLCHGQSYRVKIEAAKASNVRFSRKLPLYLEIKPDSALFALSARKHVSYWDAEVEISATIEKEF